MQIAFIDVANWDYTVESAYRMPLGGSQSAICYLGEQLAKLGHDVRLFNRTSLVTVSRGVTCAPLEEVSAATWRHLDAVIIQNWANLGIELRPRLRADAKLILWTQHAHDQPAIQSLTDARFRDAHDAYVFVSDWQRGEYQRAFGISAQKSHVLRNAIGPAFENLFTVGEDVLAAKHQPLLLAYTSTPFRGLDVLLEVFPRIRQAIPDAILRVYSSMQVYQMAADRDATKFGHLYQQCRSTPGVEYIGSLPQPELAKELKAVSVLAYPNTFAETSCIAVMEALASGCQVVTSDLVALPETSAGFATLISTQPSQPDFADAFTDATISALRSLQVSATDAGGWLSQQVRQLNEHTTWEVRAQEWQAWLQNL